MLKSISRWIGRVLLLVVSLLLGVLLILLVREFDHSGQVPG